MPKLNKKKNEIIRKEKTKLFLNRKKEEINKIEKEIIPNNYTKLFNNETKYLRK